MKQFYAHTPVGDRGWHDLVTHLRQTAELARRNGEKFGAGELLRLAGLWHDVGKFNPEFQEYLERCYRAEREGERPPAKGVPHAVYGAVLAAESLQLLAPALHGHHAGLPRRARLQDALDPENRELHEAHERIEGVAREQMGGLRFEGDVSGLASEPPRDHYQMEFFVRMVFSALVDADFLDTESHFEPQAAGLRGSRLSTEELWRVLERDQERKISDASPTTVNGIRNDVYCSCLQAAELPQGVFRLSVPMGGGKTRSGLAFALRHAVKHGLDRVIVAAPYTSIIEQTADEFRRIFEELGEEAVLEHHSAVRREEVDGDSGEAERQDESRLRRRLATQNWDAPLVVTTTVQLMESLFANRTSRCRKLHNIARSVIVGLRRMSGQIFTMRRRLLSV